MIAGPSTLSQLFFSVSSDEQGKLDTYYDDFLLRIETPHYDDISTGNVLFTRFVSLSDFVYHTTWASLLCISILWIARCPLRETLFPLDRPQDHVWARFNCMCSHSPASSLERQPPPSQEKRFRPSTSTLAQAPGSLGANSPKNESLTEAKNAPNDEVIGKIGGNVGGSPQRSPSPGRTSQVTRGLAQASNQYHAALDGPSTCPLCGGSTSATQRTRRAGGRTELTVQDKNLVLTTEMGYISDPHSISSSPTDSVPLIRTLNHGSSEEPASSDDSSGISALDILVIAKSDEGGERPLKGPEVDADYLRRELGRLPNVRFHALADFDATLDKVYASLTGLWKNPEAGSHLLFFFTGHGIENKMELYEDGFIDESYLQGVLQQLNQEDPKQLRTIAIFDICRYSEGKPVASMNHRISLIWSCSLGERAGSLQFKSRAPGSFFLNALFRAYQDVCDNQPGSPEDHLKARVKQLALYDSYRDHLESEPKCKVCIRDRRWCSKAFAMGEKLNQNVDLSQAQGDLKRLFDFLQHEGYDGRLPDGVLAFFSKLELFEERSKYSSQMSYLLRNLRDTQAWQGWLSSVVWSFWECMWILLLLVLPFNRLTGGLSSKRVGVKGEKRRSSGVDQAPSPEAANPNEASPQPAGSSKSELRGAKVSVASAPAPRSV